MLKSRNTPKGHHVLVIALAVIDSVALITTAVSQQCVYEIFGMDIRAITNIGCKLFMGIWQSASKSSSSVVVLICIERFVAVWLPLRSRYLLSRKLVLRSVWVCVVPIVLIFVLMSILYCEIKDGLCNPNIDGSVYSTVLKRIPDTTVYNAVLGLPLIISMVILSIFTPMIIVKLYKQRSIRRQLTNQEWNMGHFHTSVKLIAVVVVHITLVGLPVVVALALGITGINLTNTSQAGKIVLSSITLAVLLNHSTNFLLYNIFDAEFRRKALTLFGVTNVDAEPGFSVEKEE